MFKARELIIGRLGGYSLKAKILIAAGAAALIFYIAARAGATEQTNRIIKNEMGLKKMQIVFPESGSRIFDTQPMITASAELLKAPLDPETVTITLNGADVTDSAELAPSYVSYQPDAPLLPGKYDVRVTAGDINKGVIEPLVWSFSIDEGAAGEDSFAAAQAPIEKERDNTSGKLSVSSDFVSADFVPQAAVDISQLFREKEGMKQNADFTFTNISEGRTLLGSYHRETQSYTDIEIDKGRLDYFDSDFNATLGAHWFSLSDLTVYGTELNGMSFDRKSGPWGVKLFSGRTQDPSTSGTFKQIASGFRGTYEWNEKGRTSVTALTASESHDAAHELTSSPAKDRISGILHEQKFGKNIKAVAEAAQNHRKIWLGDSVSDSAARLLVSGTLENFTAEAEAYRIGEDYFPIADGSSKYLKNDRAGARAKGSYQLSSMIVAGGEYERYDTESTDVITKRGNAFVTLRKGMIQALTYRKGKLVSGGTISETDSVTTLLVLPAVGNFTETRVSAGAQQIKYESSGILTETSVRMFSLNTSFRDKLGISANFSTSDTDDEVNLTNSKNKSMLLGLNWNIIPFKLIWMGRYELADSSGSTADTNEKTIKSNFKYYFNKVYAVNLAYDHITYDDAVSPIYNYEQDIVRSGFEWSF